MCVRWGGGGPGGHNLPLTVPRFPPPVFFCPFVSRFPPFIVFLPLPCKSRGLTPCSNRDCFGFVQKKNCFVNRTTSHSTARSLKRHSFDTSLHHAAKSSVFCELQSYGASSQEGLPWTDFSPPHRDQSKWSLTTFYLTRFVVLTENFDS